MIPTRRETDAVRLAELLAALSLVTDLGIGQPMEHILRQTLIAMRLGESLGLSDDERADLYYVALLAWVGCGADSSELARWFGDDIAFRAQTYESDLVGLRALTFIAKRAGAGETPLRRALTAASFLATAGKRFGASMATHCIVTAIFADRVGLRPDVREALLQAFERWDGKGGPRGLRGDAIAVSIRITQVADLAVAYHRAGGADAAVGVLRERSGTQFDPAIVDRFASDARSILREIDAVESWDAVLEAEPGLRHPMTDDTIDVALEAIGDFTEIKTPHIVGHARAVAALAEDGARALGLPPGEALAVRRAALVQDAGRMGVSNGIWDKAGPLSPSEVERVRLHAYYVERMLQRTSGLARVAALAAQHHERLDGSGYPRGMIGAAIPAGARILAAADVYRALIEERPHRAALAPEDAAAVVRAEVKAGRLDGDAVHAVLAAAGHRIRRRRGWPAGLTPREVEVLALIARGLSNREVARRLHVAEKTVGNHIEHIYTKVGCSSRAEASLFAMQHGLLDLADPAER